MCAWAHSLPGLRWQWLCSSFRGRTFCLVALSYSHPDSSLCQNPLRDNSHRLLALDPAGPVLTPPSASLGSTVGPRSGFFNPVPSVENSLFMKLSISLSCVHLFSSRTTTIHHLSPGSPRCGSPSHRVICLHRLCQSRG